MPWNQAFSFRYHVVRGTRASCTLWVETPQWAGALAITHMTTLHSTAALETDVIASDQSPFVPYRGPSGIRVRVRTSGLIWTMNMV